LRRPFAREAAPACLRGPQGQGRRRAARPCPRNIGSGLEDAMRYRPFGATGKAVSAISLLLREAPNMHSPAAWRALAFCAMENGVNSFELTAGSDVLAMGVGEALSAVERRLIFLGWRLRGAPGGKMTARDIAESVRGALQKTRAGYLDVLMMDEAAIGTLTSDARTYLVDLKNGGVCLQIGVVGDG